jgi:hypothetical protein
MKEFIALLAVNSVTFILGSFSGAGVYHAILRVAKKGESEVKEYSQKAAELVDAAKAYSEKILAEAYKKAGAIEQDVKDGLPHA